MKSLRDSPFGKLLETFLEFLWDFLKACQKCVIIILGRRTGAGASVLRPKNIEYCGRWSLLRCSF